MRQTLTQRSARGWVSQSASHAFVHTPERAGPLAVELENPDDGVAMSADGKHLVYSYWRKRALRVLSISGDLLRTLATQDRYGRLLVGPQDGWAVAVGRKRVDLVSLVDGSAVPVPGASREIWRGAVVGSSHALLPGTQRGQLHVVDLETGRQGVRTLGDSAVLSQVCAIPGTSHVLAMDRSGLLTRLEGALDGDVLWSRRPSGPARPAVLAVGGCGVWAAFAPGPDGGSVVVSTESGEVAGTADWSVHAGPALGEHLVLSTTVPMLGANEVWAFDLRTMTECVAELPLWGS